MENENVKVVVETLATSLNNTQKNATDTENSVKQILSMSGKEMHEMTVTAILADDKLEMAEKLVRCGIKAILNFAHVDLNVPEGVQVENVHLSDSLMKLSYNIHKYEENVGRANEKGIQ